MRNKMEALEERLSKVEMENDYRDALLLPRAQYAPSACCALYCARARLRSAGAARLCCVYDACSVCGAE